MAGILSKRKIKPLFIGFGKQAMEYAKVFDNLKIQISAVCVRDLSKDKKKLDEFKIKNRYDSLISALSSKSYNCIFVFLPWHLIEKKIVLIIKNSKKIIFCEKPLALSYKKLIKIEKVSNEFNKKLYILYNRRYYETLNFLKKNINKKYSNKISIPEKKNKVEKLLGKKIIGKIKFHYTSHWIDFFKFLFNSEITELTKQNNKYLFTLENPKKKLKVIIELYYSENNSINAVFKTKTIKYRLDTLEKLYIYKSRSKKIKINEYKQNTFKPGILKLVNNILNSRLKELNSIKVLKNDYFFLQKLPH